jgi:hypothetical protein
VLAPGLTGGFAAVTRSMNVFNAGVGTRIRRAAATLSIVSSTFVVRSPVNAEICRIGAKSRNRMPWRRFSSKRSTKV